MDGQFQIAKEIDPADFSPTEDDLRDYALSLGMDPDTDSKHMHIAKEGIQASIPQGWKTYVN